MKKALIVDPHADIRHLLEVIAEKFGYECVTAANFAEAGAALVREPFDLIVCDCEKEEDRCEEMIARLHERHSDLPIVVFTEKPAHSLAPEFRDDYCFIFKKFDFKGLQQVLSDSGSPSSTHRT